MIQQNIDALLRFGKSISAPKKPKQKFKFNFKQGIGSLVKLGKLPLNAIKNPVAKLEFYRKEKLQIDLAYMEADRVREEAQFREREQWATARFFEQYPDPNSSQRKLLQNLESKSTQL